MLLSFLSRREGMNNLKQLLVEKNISQIWLAKKIGVDTSMVSKWTKWGLRIPEKHTMKICKVLKCKLSQLNAGGIK
jgi:DNA-binding Xre family transcriptional regulator